MVARKDATIKRAGYPYVTQRELKVILTDTWADEIDLMRVFNLSTDEYRDIRVELRRILRRNASSVTDVDFVHAGEVITCAGTKPQFWTLEPSVSNSFEIDEVYVEMLDLFPSLFGAAKDINGNVIRSMQVVPAEGQQRAIPSEMMKKRLLEMIVTREAFKMKQHPALRKRETEQDFRWRTPSKPQHPTTPYSKRGKHTRNQRFFRSSELVIRVVGDNETTESPVIPFRKIVEDDVKMPRGPGQDYKAEELSWAKALQMLEDPIGLSYGVFEIELANGDTMEIDGQVAFSTTMQAMKDRLNSAREESGHFEILFTPNELVIE